MNQFLNDIWPLVEEIGLPFLAGIGLISFGSLNFYFSNCRNLRRLEKHLIQNRKEQGFSPNHFPRIGLPDIFYGFRPQSRIDADLMRFPLYEEGWDILLFYRKIYRIVFPLIITLGVLGIWLNETIIDQ